MDENLWKAAVKTHPELESAEGIKDSPEDFVALVKILNTAKRAEESGNHSFSEYKNVESGLRLIDETKLGAKIFDRALTSEQADIMQFYGVPGLYVSHSLHCNDYMPTTEEEMNRLLNTSAPLEELQQVKDDLTVSLMENFYKFVDCEIKNVNQSNEINRIIKENPRQIMALMAISEKNRQNGMKQVRAYNNDDLKAKLNMPEVQKLSRSIPLSEFNFMFDGALRGAQPLQGMDKPKNINPRYFSEGKSYLG